MNIIVYSAVLRSKFKKEYNKLKATEKQMIIQRGKCQYIKSGLINLIIVLKNAFILKLIN